MRLLLDTHAILWYIGRDPTLSARANAAIKLPDNEIHASVVSLWELSIKTSLGKLQLPKPIRDMATELRDGGVAFLPISEEHAMAVEALPWHHRDPFDRMLVVQAQQEGLTVVTRDPLFGQYEVSRFW